MGKGEREFALFVFVSLITLSLILSSQLTKTCKSFSYMLLYSLDPLVWENTGADFYVVAIHSNCQDLFKY